MQVGTIFGSPSKRLPQVFPELFGLGTVFEDIAGVCKLVPVARSVKRRSVQAGLGLCADADRVPALAGE